VLDVYMGEKAQQKPVLFADPAACCSGPGAPGCACGREERALRAICFKQYRPMTPAEREWCKQEITRVEGYSPQDAEGTDAEVASVVLRAWADYCRDKGLM
jgi:hypothetical protein